MKKQKLITLIFTLILTTSAFASMPIAEVVRNSAGEDRSENTAVSEDIAVDEQYYDVPVENGFDITSDPVVMTEIQADLQAPALITALKEKKIAEMDFETLQELARFEETYNLSDAEKACFVSWINNGKDVRLLIYIYEFWLTTEEDISIIEDVYDMFVDGYDPEMRLPSDKDLWFEGLFNFLSGNRYGKLTTAVTEEYMDKGLSLEDIKMAERMSRTGRMNVGEILEKKSAGTKWCDIAAEVNNIPELHNRSELNVDELQDILTLIKITGKSATEILKESKNSSAAELLENHYKKGSMRAQAKLIANGLWQYDSPEIEAAVKAALSSGMAPLDALRHANDSVDASLRVEIASDENISAADIM